MCVNIKFGDGKDNCSENHIRVCDHGMVHLKCGEKTLQFTQEEFVSFVRASVKACQHVRFPEESLH